MQMRSIEIYSFHMNSCLKWTDIDSQYDAKNGLPYAIQVQTASLV